jgi:hypothetical protein
MKDVVTRPSSKTRPPSFRNPIAALAVASLLVAVPSLASGNDQAAETVGIEVAAIWWALDLPVHREAQLLYQGALTDTPLPSDARALSALTDSVLVAYRLPASPRRERLRVQLRRRLRQRAQGSNHLADQFLVLAMAHRDSQAILVRRPPTPTRRRPSERDASNESRADAGDHRGRGRASSAASARERPGKISPEELARNMALRNAAMMQIQQTQHQTNMRIIDNLRVTPPNRW